MPLVLKPQTSPAPDATAPPHAGTPSLSWGGARHYSYAACMS